MNTGFGFLSFMTHVTLPEKPPPMLQPGGAASPLSLRVLASHSDYL